MAYLLNHLFRLIYLRFLLSTSTPEAKKIKPPLQGEYDFRYGQLPKTNIFYIKLIPKLLPKLAPETVPFSEP